jgi:hypothetical protein
MRHIVFASILVAACQSKSATPSWEQQSNDFMTKFAEVLEASGGDCDKLTAGLETLAPAATKLKGELDASKHKFSEWKPNSALTARLAKFNGEPGLIDRCEKLNNPRLSKALDATLLTVSPLFEGDQRKGLGEAAKAFSDH